MNIKANVIRSKFKIWLRQIVVTILLFGFANSSLQAQNTDRDKEFKKNVYIFLDNSLSLEPEKENIANRLSELFVAEEGGLLSKNDTVYYSLFGEDALSETPIRASDTGRLEQLAEGYRNQERREFDGNTDFSLLVDRLTTILRQSNSEDVNIFVILSDFINEVSTVKPCLDIYGREFSSVNDISFRAWFDGKFNSPTKQVVKQIENFPPGLSGSFEAGPGKQILNAMLLINVDNAEPRTNLNNRRCIEEFKRPQADFVLNALQTTFSAQKANLSDVINSKDAFMQTLLTNLTLPLDISSAQFNGDLEKEQRFLELQVANRNNLEIKLNEIEVLLSGGGSRELINIDIGNGIVGPGQRALIIEENIPVAQYGKLERAVMDENKNITITSISQNRMHSPNLEFTSIEINGAYSDFNIVKVEREYGDMGREYTDFFTVYFSDIIDIASENIELGITHQGQTLSEISTIPLSKEELRAGQNEGLKIKIPQNMRTTATNQFILKINADGQLLEFKGEINRVFQPDSLIRVFFVFCNIFLLAYIFILNADTYTEKVTRFASFSAIYGALITKEVALYISDFISLKESFYDFFTSFNYNLINILIVVVFGFMSRIIIAQSSYINKTIVPEKLDEIIESPSQYERYNGMSEQKIALKIRQKYIYFSVAVCFAFIVALIVANIFS